MAWRVTPDEVRDIIDTDEDIRIEPFIKMANVMTDQVSAADTGSLLSSAVLTQIELLLSADAYALREPLITEEESADAKAKYQVTTYWEQAKRLDKTGYLKAIEKGITPVGITWIGKPTDTQETAYDRGWDRSLR